ncbi:MAG: hypothetical protein GXO88_03195 [Chlorobi bacterium]|nr:hypothetical protein [Chlorobiota bacterium]
MNKKYKNKYRIASARLPNWDYGSNALYFVAICCKNRTCFFGNVSNGTMIRSELGEMAEKYWLEIPQHFPFVVLHNHIIMPNHVHGIIEISKINNGGNVEAQNFAPLQPPYKNRFGPQSKNLASIMRGYKIGVTKNARKINPDFQWQPRYYDNVVRNGKSYNRISEYILNNPLNWNNDKLKKL